MQGGLQKNRNAVIHNVELDENRGATDERNEYGGNLAEDGDSFDSEEGDQAAEQQSDDCCDKDDHQGHGKDRDKTGEIFPYQRPVKVCRHGIAFLFVHRLPVAGTPVALPALASADAGTRLHVHLGRARRPWSITGIMTSML